MTDDLVKQLRSKIIYHPDAAIWMLEAADRIEELEERLKAATDDAKEAEAYAEELEAELHLMKTSGIIEGAVRNPNVMEYMKHWEGRAETAEAKLAKAVEFTKGVIRHAGNSGDDYLAEQARTTIAELKGEQP